MTKATYDCVIAGGGLVGATQAIALGQAGLRVAVVDKIDQRTQLDGEFDGRVSAIAHASVLILQNTGIWGHVEEAGPIADIRVTDGESPVALNFESEKVGDKPFGYMIENRLLRKAIFTRIQEVEAVDYITPHSVEAVDNTPERVVITLENGDELQAPLLLAADGRFSGIRDKLGLSHKTTGYGQTAMVATIAHTEDHGGMAVEHFLAPGPFAILPMAGGKRSAIVWTESDEMAAYYMALDEETYLAELAERCGGWLGDISLAGPRFSYPLMLITTQSTITTRAALIGDASHAIHPIAGQGVNLGYRDVAAFTDILIERAKLGLDIGAPEVLESYARERRYDTHSMGIATDGLNRLFSTDSKLAKLARRTGLHAVEKMPTVKGFFMREAMGMRGTLPSLMQEQDAA